MKKAPNLFTVESLVEHANSCHAEIKGKWVPARPIGLFSLISRIKLSFGVFIGRYDAVRWHGQ